MGAVKRFSPSALKRFAACGRSWRYSKEIEQPEKASQKLGKKSHTWLEGYMGTTGPANLKAKEGRIVLPGLKYLADVPRGGVAKLEQHFALRVDGIDLHGFIDLRHEQLVCDHKTTKDISKYALTSEALADDLQRTIYAAGALDGVVIEHAADGTELRVTDEPLAVGLDATDCRWIYYATVHHRGQDRSEWAAAREFSESRSDTMQRMGDVVLPIARRLLPLWDAPARDFDRDLRCCDDYGGCPYQETCWRDDPPTRAERAKGAEMGVLDRLRAKQQADQAAGAATTAAIDTTARDADETDDENEVEFSPDQKPAASASAAKPKTTSAANTTPPAGPPVSTTKPSDGGLRLPPKKRTSKAASDEQIELDVEAPLQLHRKFPLDAVLRVVEAVGTAEAARDMLEVVSDWAEVE